ncbi:MAG: tetratricopeptide repeat protein [Deltaproteobacteria bacterium]|nr:tetratricopeptide repeat protein [Deltaproteobacteria bacterium]
MGFLQFFSGKNPEDYEKKGDAYCDLSEFGEAKLQYENALNRLAKKRPDDIEGADRLREKIASSRESLARAHTNRGKDLMELGHYDDAGDILLLALELTEHDTSKKEIEELLKKIKNRKKEELLEEITDDGNGEDVTETPFYAESDDEYFTALVNTLPEEIRQAYLSYGEVFKKGYVALNHGEYEEALALLSSALEETGGNHISYEIGTACLNMGRTSEARSVAEAYVRDNPGLSRGYHLLCEVLWEMEAFDEAHEVIRSGPSDLRNTVPMKLLEGETLSRAGQHEKAESFYSDYRTTHGWDENIVRAQALNCEALGKTAQANDLYGQIMNDCRQCRVRVDPVIKLRYAETAFELGKLSSAILELYLSLAEEIPGDRAHFFRRISYIYASQGHEDESMRYLAFAERLEKKEA